MTTAAGVISFSFNKEAFKHIIIVAVSNNTIITAALVLALFMRQDHIVLNSVQIQNMC